MRKPCSKATTLLKTAITVDQLPPIVPRRLAADFALLHERTLARAEQKGQLSPIKRNLRTVSYDKSELLKWLGIKPKQHP